MKFWGPDGPKKPLTQIRPHKDNDGEASPGSGTLSKSQGTAGFME